MKEKHKFIEWYDKKLQIGPKPDSNKLKNILETHDIIINVCDFPFYDNMEEVIKKGKKYFWFPMNEISGDIGINSIYGALSALYYAFENDKSVYLHCFSGKNRSRVVEASLYFMFVDEHLNQVSRSNKNRIYSNVKKNRLPELMKYESFLKTCYQIFSSKEHSSLFGPIDFCKINSL
jgi:hypothetical protein